MADMTRQKRPSFSMASWRAIALMTVESMPMWSAATRSMSMACWATPRKKLPPPTTMPIWQPRACTAAISAAILWMKMASMPKPLPAAKASPEILRRILLYMSELSIACAIEKVGRLNSLGFTDGLVQLWSHWRDCAQLCKVCWVLQCAGKTYQSPGGKIHVDESTFDGFDGWAGSGDGSDDSAGRCSGAAPCLSACAKRFACGTTLSERWMGVGTGE